MAYKSKKVANCACGTGDAHSLRQAGVCDGLRTGVLTQVQATEQLARLARGNSDDRRRRGEPTNAQPITPEPAAEV